MAHMRVHILNKTVLILVTKPGCHTPSLFYVYVSKLVSEHRKIVYLTLQHVYLLQSTRVLRHVCNVHMVRSGDNGNKRIK